MSKFKNEVKATLKDFRDLYTHDWWELKESIQFYKQAFRDFVYATQLLLRLLLGVICLFVAPFLIPVAIVIRVLRKGAIHE
ncbi:hypothetical protein [Acinetobacter baumannii]|uniref:hypothetical protein n=1 Tax=Acinetobacter baumannii TaxID=470 RepID=UPI0023419164|nr:hypothetical protein [Acinetobacter baumannii]